MSMRRVARVPLLALCLAALAAAPARAQVLGRAASVCGDGSHGVSLVAQAPVAASEGSLAAVLIVRKSAAVEAYEQELRYAQNPRKTDTLEAARELQGHESRLMAAMQQVFSRAKFAQADGRGVILCGDLEPGAYEVIGIATLSQIGNASGSQSVRYYLARAAVPKSSGRAIVHATTFAPL